LLYQKSAGAIFRSVVQTSWRNYGLSQSKGALPVGPMVLVVHIASVWVPFTSEAKEAIAHYPEIIKELKLALQDVGRRLGSYIRKTVKAKEQEQRISLFDNYIPELAASLSALTGVKKDNIVKDLKKVFKKRIKEIFPNGKEK